MNKYKKNPKISALPTAQELRNALMKSEGSDARGAIISLFDADTFVETSAYTQRGFSDFISTETSNELEGVITGYGAIDGKLVFAFSEDATRMGGVIDDRHAKKITDLYKLATSNGAPIIGIFNSKGTDIFQGTSSLAAYGKIISAVNAASGVIPQIAFVNGTCIGMSAAIASMFDFLVTEKSAEFYVSSPALTGNKDAQNDAISFTSDIVGCASYIRGLISFLPDNASVGTVVEDPQDNLNRMLGELNFAGEALAAISVIADNGLYQELYADSALSVSTVFATVGGVKCGIIANSFAKSEGRINAAEAKKIAKFVNFCNSFSLPVVTLVDSLGLEVNAENEAMFAPELAKLAFAYAGATVPKVTVIMGHAIGASFVLLGSKSLGADLVYALDESEIGALSAESGVAFAWDKYITEEKSRADLQSEWRASVSSPARAAASGEIDDIIGTSELRARICSALLMLSSKGACNTRAPRRVLPL